MSKYLLTVLLALALCLVTTSHEVGQVSICGDRLSSHPVDIKALLIRDNLRRMGIDTIIVYRHWPYTNGFNGYGKVVWISNGVCQQSKIEYDKQAKPADAIQIRYSVLHSDSLVRFVLDNHLDTVRSNPTQERYHVSHDAEHYVDVSVNDKRFCFVLRGSVVHSNPDHVRAQLVQLFCDGDVTVIVDDVETVEPFIERHERK